MHGCPAVRALLACTPCDCHHHMSNFKSCIGFFHDVLRSAAFRPRGRRCLRTKPLHLRAHTWARKEQKQGMCGVASSHHAFRCMPPRLRTALPPIGHFFTSCQRRESCRKGSILWFFPHSHCVKNWREAQIQNVWPVYVGMDLRRQFGGSRSDPPRPPGWT